MAAEKRGLLHFEEMAAARQGARAPSDAGADGADESSNDNLVRIEASPLNKSPSPARPKARLTSRQPRHSPIKISPVKARGTRAEASPAKRGFHDLS